MHNPLTHTYRTLSALLLLLLLSACGGSSSAPPDTTPPTVTITDDVSDTTASGNVTFTFTFNEAVNGFATDDVTVTGGTKGTFTMASNRLSATLIVTPTSNSTGNIQVTVGTNAFVDAAANANTVGASATQAFNTVIPTPGLVTNGSFSNGATGWSGNATNVLTEGGNSYNFADVTSAGNPWDVNLSYGLNIPSSGVQYKLTFTASSNRTRALKAGIGLNQEPWTNVVSDVTLTTTPQTFVLTLTSNFSGANSRVIFDMGHDTGYVVIDDVMLEVVQNQVANGSFSNGSTGWFGNATNVVTESGNSYNFADVASAGNPWDVNLSYGLNIPSSGVQYKLTFTASSNRTRALKAGIGLNQEPWTNVASDVTLTTTPQTFVQTLTSNFSGDNSRVFFDMGHDTGHVVIDDVMLEVVN